MFGGSTHLRNLINSSQVDLAGFLDHLTTAIKQVESKTFTASHLIVLGRARDLHRFGWTMPATTELEPDAILDPGEYPRDDNRRHFSSMMMEQLG